MRKTCFWLELSLMNCQILLNTVDVCRRWMYIVLASLIPRPSQSLSSLMRRHLKFVPE